MAKTSHIRIVLPVVALWALPALAGDKPIEKRLEQYATFELTTDLTRLTPQERRMIPPLIEAARAMDDAFWRQAYGSKKSLEKQIQDPDTWTFALINYGPWDRLDDNAPFVTGVGPKRLAANFYPRDMSKDEFEQHLRDHPESKAAMTDLYTMVRRRKDRSLMAVPYHRFFKKEVNFAASKLREAAFYAEDSGLRDYLLARSEALRTSRYRESDMAWLDMKENTLDVVIGPIENYEDRLFGYKTSFEAYILVKDKDWSARLSRFARYLPELQRNLPVSDAYKTESPGTDAQLNAYDVIYYAGDCNAGSKTIAINLPNDETVQLEKGTRRLQLKNAMLAKYERILDPIADVLITPEQRQHVTFDAFFANTMFHEVAHGLGIKNTITGKGTVRTALKDQASALEEGKADVLGLYMVTSLLQKGETTGGSSMDHYVTFLAGIFRSVRFGASSAHGRANMIRFNFFKEKGAFTRDESTGTYRVDEARMREAVKALSRKILTLQGDGDYRAVAAFVEETGGVRADLAADLARLEKADIPVDTVFRQGLDVLRASHAGALPDLWSDLAPRKADDHAAFQRP